MKTRVVFRGKRATVTRVGGGGNWLGEGLLWGGVFVAGLALLHYLQAKPKP